MRHLTGTARTVRPCQERLGEAVGEKANQLASLWLAGAQRGLRTALAEPGQFPPCISVVCVTYNRSHLAEARP